MAGMGEVRRLESIRRQKLVGNGRTGLCRLWVPVQDKDARCSPCARGTTSACVGAGSRTPPLSMCTPPCPIRFHLKNTQSKEKLPRIPRWAAASAVRFCKQVSRQLHEVPTRTSSRVWIQSPKLGRQLLGETGHTHDHMSLH